MLLTLLRHAEAEPHRADDFSRLLTGEGRDQAERVGSFMADRGPRPDIILASPLPRAQETAAIVSECLGLGMPTEVPWLACGMNPTRALEEIAGFARLGSVMIVGHEPDFSSLAAHLLGLGGSDAIAIGKASLAGIDLLRPVAGSGVLRFLIPVKLLPFVR